MKISEEKIAEFKKAFGGMELYHNASWNNVGTDSYGHPFFGWEDPIFTVDYYISVYLKKDGKMLVVYAYPTVDGQGVEEFEPDEYDKVKDFVLNFMDTSEKEN